MRIQNEDGERPWKELGYDKMRHQRQLKVYMKAIKSQSSSKQGFRRNNRRIRITKGYGGVFEV